jgi:hypothetical protein
MFNKLMRIFLLLAHNNISTGQNLGVSHIHATQNFFVQYEEI